MGTIKDRNGMDLTEAEDIKKSQPEIHDLFIAAETKGGNGHSCQAPDALGPGPATLSPSPCGGMLRTGHIITVHPGRLPAVPAASGRGDGCCWPQSPGREAALAWASLAQRFRASSVLARDGAGCGSVGDARLWGHTESDMTEVT